MALWTLLESFTIAQVFECQIFLFNVSRYLYVDGVVRHLNLE